MDEIFSILGSACARTSVISELTQQDGRALRERQTLCDKRDNNFV